MTPANRLMVKLLCLFVALVSLFLGVRSDFAGSPFLLALEEAVKSADPEAFQAAYSTFTSEERDLTGHHLWTLYIENRSVKYAAFLQGDRYTYPENYAEKRTRLLHLLFEKELITTDCLAQDRHTLQAAMENDIEALDFLVRNGFSLNVCDASGNTPLLSAIFSGFFRCAWMILMQGDENVFIFTWNQGFDLLQTLLEAPIASEELDARELVAQYLRDRGFGYEETKEVYPF